MDLRAARNSKRVLIAGHRGNWGGNIPPNTIASYKAALMLGVDMIEADIQQSADGVFYAFHTGEEKGCFGIGRRLGEMSAAEIEALTKLEQTLKFSVIIVAAVPVLCIYPFIQKFFVKGVMVGSVKG